MDSRIASRCLHYMFLRWVPPRQTPPIGASGALVGLLRRSHRISLAQCRHVRRMWFRRVVSVDVSGLSSGLWIDGSEIIC
eukprot:5344272-Alexandrium_andersonii.AAC.1